MKEWVSITRMTDQNSLNQLKMKPLDPSNMNIKSSPAGPSNMKYENFIPKNMYDMKYEI